jgi:hypothetical protein
MTMRVTVIVADDLLVSLTGKLSILGTYTGDIVVASDPMSVAQIVFLFNIEGHKNDLPRSLTLEVTLPGEQPRRLPIQAPGPDAQFLPGRTHWTIKMPFLFAPAILRQGKITTKVLHEGGEIEATGTWIVTPPNG